MIQAINKVPDHNGTHRYFDKNDSGMLEMIANLASTALTNTIQYNQQSLYMNNLRTILRIGVKLFSIKTVEKLVVEGTEILKTLFNSQEARLFYILPEEQDTLCTIEASGEKTRLPMIGIVGECMAKKQMISVNNSPADARYNGTRL